MLNTKHLETCPSLVLLHSSAFSPNFPVILTRNTAPGYCSIEPANFQALFAVHCGIAFERFESAGRITEQICRISHFRHLGRGKMFG